MSNSNQNEEDSASKWEDQFSGDESANNNNNSNPSSSSSDDSESSSDSSDESSSSSASSNEPSHQQPSTSVGLSRTFQIRNRRRNPLPTTANDISPSHSSSKRKSARTGTGRQPQSILSLYQTSISTIFSKKSSALLLFSTFIWLYVQFHFGNDVQSSESSMHYKNNPRLEKRVQELRKQREMSGLEALGSAAGRLFKRNPKISKDGYTPAAERMPSDCSLTEWQTLSFPNCNDVHNLDLREVLNIQKHGEVIPANLGEGDQSELQISQEDKGKAMRMGYVGSGLWRQVWKVQPRFRDENAVLKVMKKEHDVNPRNFDRHRRDALVMERLTSSPHVVSIYGLCGNTVLTEYAGVTLDDFLYEGAKYENTEKYDRDTPTGKIELALDVMKGLKAMHDRDIVHADIQSKQFLLDPTDGVKVNDFNRCRFLPKHDKTGDVCKVKIPSAPGGQRSPEEYEMQKIDTKIDVFSAGNILYGILTGHKPWDEDMNKDMQRNVMKGIKPKIDEQFRIPGTADAALAEIVLKAYEFDPDDRWSATQIVDELEKVLKEHGGRSSNVNGEKTGTKSLRRKLVSL